MATTAKGPRAAVGYHLWRATVRWRRALAEALAAHELTPPQFFVLGSLYWLDRHEGGSPTQRELARRAGLDPMSTSQNVRALESRGVLDRTPDPDDGRAYRLELTAAGRRLGKAATATARAIDRSFFAPLGDNRQGFVDQLKELSTDDD